MHKQWGSIRETNSATRFSNVTGCQQLKISVLYTAVYNCTDIFLGIKKKKEPRYLHGKVYMIEKKIKRPNVKDISSYKLEDQYYKDINILLSIYRFN